MIRVNNGYVLAKAQKHTITFGDTVSAVSRPILAPKCELLTNAQGGYMSAWKTLNNVYPIVPLGRVISGNYDAAIIQGDTPIMVDALHIVTRSGYDTADFVCKFKFYPVWTSSGNPGWDCYSEYSYDDGATWSTPVMFGQRIYDQSGDPAVVKSYLYSIFGSARTCCLLYGGNYYHVAPYFGIQMGGDSSDRGTRAATAREGQNFAAIIQSEPIANSDQIHTVSGVVT